MLVNPEDRLAYWGHKYQNVACRDINDDSSPDPTGLERILYGIGFLAITALTGVNAFDEVNPQPEQYSTETAAVADLCDELLNREPYEGAEEDLLRPKTYVIDHEPEDMVFEEKAGEEESTETAKPLEDADMPAKAEKHEKAGKIKAEAGQKEKILVPIIAANVNAPGKKSS